MTGYWLLTSEFTGLRGFMRKVRWNDGVGLPMGSRCNSRENQRHYRKQRQHCQIDNAGDRIPAGDILAKRPILECDGKQDFGGDQQTQRKQSRAQADNDIGGEAETLGDESRRHPYHDEHEWHLDEFGGPFAEVWHQKGHAYRSQDKACAEYQREVSHAGLDGSSGEIAHRSIIGRGAV